MVRRCSVCSMTPTIGIDLAATDFRALGSVGVVCNRDSAPTAAAAVCSGGAV